MSAGTDRDSVDSEADLARLLDLVEVAGGKADDPARERLRALAGAISRWNRDINLVSRKDIARLITYHFCDSASVLPLLRRHRGPRLAGPAGQGGPSEGGLEVLDVGGSNGLPGMVLAAVMPGMRLTVCDSQQKRLGFLGEACRVQEPGPDVGARPEVIIENAVFEMGRVESQDFQARHRASFDLIVARAVTRLRLLAKWCLPLLKPGGRLVAYKGSHCAEEMAHAQAYLFEHGASLAAVTASPWAELCNPLRIFAIVDKT